jgi:hypothetical protein
MPPNFKPCTPPPPKPPKPQRGTCDHCLKPNVRLIEHTRAGDVGLYRVCAVCASQL